MHCKMIHRDGPIDKVFAVRDGETSVGRDSDCDIQISHSTVSRRHAVLYNMPSVCELEDLGSKNGTFVNGVRSKRMVLKHGDEVRFGDIRVTFEVIDATAMDMDHNARDYSPRESENTVVMRVIPDEKHEKPKPAVAPMKPLQPLVPKDKE